MAFAGLRGTDDWGSTERPTNFREWILWANPNGRAPLVALMARMAKESTDDPQFNWYEETQQIVRITVNYGTGYISTDNTITVDSGALNLVAGDLILVEKAETATYDNELIEVSSVTSDTVFVAKRGAAGSTAAAIADNVYLTRVGNTFMEGDTSPDVSLRNPTRLYNYTQIFKTAVGLTRTAKGTKVRTGDSWKNDKKRKSFDHSVSMELAYMFGQRSEDTTGTYPKRTMGGLREFITTNVTIFSTTPTEDTLLAALYPVFDYDSGAGDERIVFAGNGFLNSLNKLARDSSSTQINFEKEITKLYGMNLNRWVVPQGSFLVKTHPLMNVHGRFTYSAFVIDPTSLKYRYMLDTKFEDNIQANDADLRKAQWITECGLEVQHEESMGYIGNFVV